MADSCLIHPSISALINLSIGRISSDEVQKVLTKQAKTSLLLEQLKSKLLTLSDFLADAEQKASSTDQRVNSWLDDLKAVMYDAENALDSVALQGSRSKSSSKASFKKVHRSIFACIIPSDGRIDSELTEILKRLDGILEQASVLQLQGNGGQVGKTKKLVAAGLMNPRLRKYVGRDLEIKELTDFMEVNRENEMVEFDSDSIRVVLISGVSGVGKTAVAELLYNDARLDDMFDVKVWLQFQRDFHLLEVFRCLYEEIFQNLCSADMETTEKKLRDFMKGKKLLLVFDDVCFERFGSWEDLLRPISVGAKGTTIIVTTCSDNASSLIHPPPGYSFHLKPLSDNDCWSIIKSIALDQEFPLDGKLDTIGRKMALKCKGLPLAAVVLGGILRFIPQEIRELEAILKSPLLKSSNDIRDILRLSYNCLDYPELKLCFAYCSLFPKNYRFEREELVLLWMAEGFLASNDTQITPEELGNAYFNELVSRSLFQYMGAKENFSVMHNLIHDLAVSTFGEIRNTQHIAYVQTRYHDSGKLQALSNGKLRTFFALRSVSNDYFCYMPRMELPDVFPKWSCLRVLSLSHYQISTIPSSVGNLRHLRYLNLSFTRIRNLPKSIQKLYKLQTLLLSNCGRLTRLPTELGHMISLRHLDISSTDSLQEMPYQICKLNNLQRLSKFVLGKERGAKISELGKLQSLKGALVISGLENVDSQSSAKAANIRGKALLIELVYQWYDHSMGQTHVLDELKPHVNLERLTIHGFYGTKFPNWVGAPEYHRMVVLNLNDWYSCISLPPLGQLSSLKQLSIEGFRKVVEVGPEFYGSNSNSSSFTPFPSLEILKFKEMCSWRQWRLFQGEGLAFPNLKELCLDFCPALLGELPINLPLLRKLDIRFYPELTNSLPQLPSIRNLTLKRCILPDLHIVKDLTSLSSLKIDTPGNSTSSLHINPSIENLETKFCNFDEALFHAPSWLRSLTLTHPRNLGLFSSDCYKHLRYLSIMGAKSLSSFELNLFPYLIYLDISSCHNIKSFLLPQDYSSDSLHDLSISDCHNLVEFPSNGLPLPKLRRFTVTGCTNLKSLPEKMCITFVLLNLLSIENCPEINTFPLGGLPQSLLTLKISTCNNLISNRKDWQLENLISLKQLEIGGDGYVGDFESFPDGQFLLPRSLQKLSINGFKNLKCLNSGGINVLTCLEELKISGCPKIESFPEDLMIPSLCSVDFSKSRTLELRCLQNGEDWPKISHLPRIRVAGCEF